MSGDVIGTAQRTARFETGVTVRSVLALPALRRGVPEVLTGAAQLDREIRWVHTAEVRNIASLLEGGELLLTTGMTIGTRAAEQAALARALASRGVAGLVLELGTTFATAPTALVTACAEHDLPLIALHRQVPFVAITEAIHAELINRQFALMQRGDELHRRFAELLLKGAGLPDLLEELADVTGNPVVLERRGGDLVYRAAHRTRSSDVLAAWEAYARGLPSAPEGIERPILSEENRPSGRLVALALQRPLDRFDAVAVERAAGFVSLALLYDRDEDAVAHRERRDFLAQVVRGDLDESEAATRAASFSFEAQTLLPVAIGRRSPRVGRLTSEEDARWSRVWRDVRRDFDERGTPALLGGDAEHGLLVIGMREQDKRAAVADRVAAQLNADVLRHLGGARTAIVCVGRTTASWTGLTVGLRRVLELVPAAAHARDRPWHDIEDPDVDRLLWSLRDWRELRDFVDARLGPVLEHDRRRSAKLLPTLEALCHHGGRKAATARALHLERPSLYHRIARLERLLGTPLADEDTLLGIHLALRARQHLDPHD